MSIKELKLEEIGGFTVDVHVGDIVLAKVEKVENDQLLCSLYKDDKVASKEAFLPREQYSNEKIDSLIDAVKVNDTIKVKVTEEKGNFFLVSQRAILNAQAISHIRQISEDKEVVSGIIKSVFETKPRRPRDNAFESDRSSDTPKGEEKKPRPETEKGFLVKFGDQNVFLPFRYIEKSYSIDPEKFKNQSIDFLVCYQTRDIKEYKFVGSRRDIILQERDKRKETEEADKKKAFEDIKKGDILSVRVVRVDKTLIHIMYGPVHMILPISRYDYKFIEDLTQVVKVGDKFDVKVLETPDKKKLDVSRKALLPSPVSVYTENHQVGEVVKGKVLEKIGFGIRIDLGDGVSGFLHKSEYSWKPDEQFDDKVKIGEEVELQIIGFVNKKGKKSVDLSRKALFENPWGDIDIKQGDIVNVEIKSKEKYGYVVSYGEIDGFIKNIEIPSSENFTGNVKYSVGDHVQAEIISIDKGKRSLQLSIKSIVAKQETIELQSYYDEVDEDGGSYIGDILEFQSKKIKPSKKKQK